MSGVVPLKVEVHVAGTPWARRCSSRRAASFSAARFGTASAEYAPFQNPRPNQANWKGQRKYLVKWCPKKRAVTMKSAAVRRDRVGPDDAGSRKRKKHLPVPYLFAMGFVE